MPAGDHPAPVAYSVTSANDFPDRDPKDWRLLGSADGREWTVLDARQGQSFFGRHFRRLFRIERPAAFPLYRFEVLANHGNAITQIEEVELLVPAEPDPELTAADIEALKALAGRSEGYRPLFAPDLSDAQTPKDAWEFAAGVLVAKGGGDIWTKERYGDFILDLEFRCAADTNSGVFLRCASVSDWLHTAIEIQIQQPVGDNNRHNCGAVFDVKGPRAAALRPAGEWNHYTILAKANRILVWLNGVLVNDIDLNLWSTPGRNPDGSRNKFPPRLPGHGPRGIRRPAVPRAAHRVQEPANQAPPIEAGRHRCVQPAPGFGPAPRQGAPADATAPAATAGWRRRGC